MRMPSWSLLSVAVLAAGISISACGAHSADDLWFFADFDSVPQIAGRAFFNPLPVKPDVEGRYGKGYLFESDEKRCENKYWVVRDRELLKTFPAERGSFACWYRSPEDKLGMKSAPLFCLGGFWHYNWRWSGGEWRTTEKRGEQLPLGKAFVRETKWHHFAATWNERGTVAYVDGEKVAEKASVPLDAVSAISNAVLRIGTGGDGSCAANLVVDELAFFGRDLSPAEVKGIATSEKGLLDGRRRILAAPFALPFFWRDDPAAALNLQLAVPASAAGEYSVDAEIGGKRLSGTTANLVPGENDLVVPFDAWRYRAGKYPYRVALKSAGGRIAFSCGGMLEVFPRLDRGKFKFFSWGGSKAASPKYLHEIGINLVGVSDVASARAATRNGFMVNLRYDNYRTRAAVEFDLPRVSLEAHGRMRPLAGLYSWVSTLVNTEMYGDGRLVAATNNPGFAAYSSKELRNPVWAAKFPPLEIDWNALGRKGPPRGTVDEPAVDSLAWFLSSGMPLYRVGGAVTKAIHALRPDVVSWSEPFYGGGGFMVNFDMGADWIYDYPAGFCAYNARAQYGCMRPLGRPYMPTLGMGYWHFRIPPAYDYSKTGKDGKHPGVKISQTADELMVKSWIAVGSVPAAALSYFAADYWEHEIAEPDAAARYGEFMRKTFVPAAELLRGMTNAVAPVAIAYPHEIDLCVGWKWGRYHYKTRWGDALGEGPIPFDVLYDPDLTSQRLSNYKYVMVPTMSVLTKRHEAAFRGAAASGTVVVSDDYDAFLFPGGVKLPIKYDYPPDGRGDPKLFDIPFRSWYAGIAGEMRKLLPAWSEQDGTNAFTFVKEHLGVRYVIVVNNARQVGGALQNEYCRAPWYNPLGRQQRIVTHIRADGDSVVYDALAGRRLPLKNRNGEFAFAMNYAAAQGRVFAVYPTPLAAPALKVEGEALQVSIRDAQGRSAPGRQIVEVTVRDETGAERDESGRYAVEGGSCRVRILLADDDKAGFASGKWRYAVRDLTTGLETE